jgi:uncharacterized SAM-binding protein YcdF (DUF218 family)
MSILFILILLILAISFAIYKHIKTCIAILLVMLVTFFIIGGGLLPNCLLKHLESPYQTTVKPEYSSKRNAIVVLGAGVVKIPDTNVIKPTVMAYSRIFEGLQLYQSCKKNRHPCTLILSGGDVFTYGVSEALVYKNELLKLNVPASDVQVESQSMNTYKNAEFTSQYLKDHKFERVFLVTSGIHMRRALLYFSHFGIQMVPAPSDYLKAWVCFVPSGYNFAMTDFALHEYIGLLRYHIYNLLGWNAKAVSPGYP